MRPNVIRISVLFAASLLVILPSLLQIATASSPTNACALLSQSQVAMSLGTEVDPGKNILGPGDCRWVERGKATGADVAVLQVNLLDAQAFEIGKTPLPRWNKTPITGIGDSAYIADDGKITFLLSPSLSVKKGPVFFVVVAKVPKASLEQMKALEKTLATAILEKL